MKTTQHIYKDEIDQEIEKLLKEIPNAEAEKNEK